MIQRPVDKNATRRMPEIYFNDVQTDNPQETLIEREIRQQRERELPCTSCKRLRIRSNSRKKSRKKRRQTPRRDAGPDSGHPEGYPHP